MDDVQSLTPAILLLLVGVLAITSMRRIGLSPIVGYLAAGLAVGPHGFDLIAESDTTHLLAELGVVFLLFDIGLHFSPSRIWEARRDIFGLGPLQIALCGAAFGGLAWATGLPPVYAVLLGGALALSSTAVVIPTLAERGQRNCPVGLTGTAVLIFQDVCAIFLLVLAVSLDGAGASGPALVSAAAPEGGGTEPAFVSAVSMAVVEAALAFVVAIAVGRSVVGPVFRFLARTDNAEVFTAMSLLVVLAAAAATGALGLSLTLGAFLAGMMIAETPHRHVVQMETKPFRDLLLAFFFITVGMSLDWRAVGALWFEILAFVAVLVLVKVLLVSTAARAFGWSRPGSIQLAFLLAQGSEFVFVIVAMPATRDALGEAAVGVVVTGVAVSLAATPTLTNLGNRLARALRRRSQAAREREAVPPSMATAPILVFGMDAVGRSVADALEAHELRYEAVEMDYDRFLAASADGYPVAYGDLGDMRMWEPLGAAERAVVVVTIVRYELSEALMPVVRDRFPTLTRFVTVDTADDAARFEALGMRAVVDRSLPRGLDLAAAVLRSQGVPDERVEAWMARRQERALETVGADASPAAA